MINPDAEEYFARVPMAKYWYYSPTLRVPASWVGNDNPDPFPSY